MSRVRRRRVQYIDRETIRLRGAVAQAEGMLRNPAFRDMAQRRDAYATITAGKATLTALAAERYALTAAIKAEDAKAPAR